MYFLCKWRSHFNFASSRSLYQKLNKVLLFWFFFILSHPDNPVYGKGVSSTLQLSERPSISASGSLQREDPLVYQPLVENTRPRGATWGQPVYQPLAGNRYSDITVGNRRLTPPREVPRSSTLGRYESIARETNGFYQPLVMHGPGMVCMRWPTFKWEHVPLN